MSVDLVFALLPALSPEPSLIRTHWERGTQFEDTILAFGDLDLCTRFVEVQPASHLGRQRHYAARLHTHIPMKSHNYSIPPGP
jgi:hypothetical protein